MKKQVIWLVAVVALVLAGPMALAAASGKWASINNWNSTEKTGLISIADAKGFPSAAITSDSKGTTGPAANAWLDTWTSPGSKYGSSKTKNYLNLGPISSTKPSTTTYTFDYPTPSSGWMFALGDIDSEALEISAKDSTGNPVSIDDLGYQGAFNYCNNASGLPTSCGGTQSTVTPNWDSSQGRLQATTNTDTNGSAAWFEPKVSLSSLTIKSTSLLGFPVYQTWFAALTRDITGTVTGSADCSADGLTVTLRDRAGLETIATTQTDNAGAWSISTVATYDDWLVTIDAPDECRVDDGGDRTVDLSSNDANVSVTLQKVQGSVIGSVVDLDDEGIDGALVTIATPDGETTLQTDENGEFGPEGLPQGNSNVAVITPEGYEVDGDDSIELTVTNVGEDFEVQFTLNPVEDAGQDGGGGQQLPETGGINLSWLLLAVFFGITGLMMLPRRIRN